jgi:H+/Cl- antiporter ClcA
MFVLGGATVGATAVALAVLADKAQLKFAQFASLWWIPFVLTPLGFGLCAYIATRWFRGSQGSGIPQTIAAHRSANPRTRNQLVSLRVACGKIALTVLGLLCGASMGREGPTVQIGAAIMFSVGKLSPRTQPGLIVAGCAAGVAAAFNAPLAGIMFAIEEMSRSFERHTSGLIIAAVIAAGLMAMWLLGNYTYFGSTSGSIARADWLAVVICGIFGGLAGGIFSRILIAASSAAWRQRFRLNSMRGAVSFAMLCGLAVVICGALSGSAIYGTGYTQVKAALVGSQPLQWYFMPLKFCATVFSSISGIPGGIFSPSLAIGAGLGSEIAPWFPSSSVGLLMLLGMVGYLAGVVQAPMTAFVIVTEMTNDHAMLMPLMAAALLAHASSRLVCPEGLYHALARNFLEPHPAPSPA